MATTTSDFLVVGGGVVGLTIAAELRARHPGARITVLEKEASCGQHASGRNSGVLHAGFYYSPDSLKAQFARDGNRDWVEYCREHRLPINPCGKLVTTTSPQQLGALHNLHSRGLANGVPVELIDARQAAEIEPRARTVEQALWSPSTASVDPARIMTHLAQRLNDRGVEIRTGVRALGPAGDGGLRCTDGNHAAGMLINAAGLHADRVARWFGFARYHRMLPFKGVYLYGEPGELLRTHVYPVPDPELPFLGVHFTVTVDGRTKIGPTAMPAFWREQYRGLSRFRPGELAMIGWQLLHLLLARRGFGRHAVRELSKYSRRRLVRLAAELVPDVRAGNYRTWSRSGIRAQLVDRRSGTLEMDFLIEGDTRSLHVLNAVSPAFTCAWPVARHVASLVDAPSGEQS